MNFIFRKSNRIRLAGLAGALAIVVFDAGEGRVSGADKATLPPAAARPIDFLKDIQPIFEASCFKCHGPDKQKGELRLDRKESALRGGDSGKVILPGKSADSLLIQLVAGLVQDKVMPAKGDRLTAEQVGRLRAWIDQGAPWPEPMSAAAQQKNHWAFQPVKDPVPPAGNPDWIRNPIDAFVLARLKAAGLKPSPAADRVTLIRRIYLDLLGLPPTPEEIQQFVADRKSDGYPQLIERVLASPRYGERWARHWLDVARFAETHGYERNLERPTAWPYRDYVIAAFNDDKPYDRFIFEQLAGDTAAADAATGFLVGGQYDDVKSNEEKFRLLQRQDELADMINTTGTAFLGLTLGCARCHTHKFDPITHTDYFALQAVLAGVEHGERPFQTAAHERNRQQAALVQQRIDGLRSQLEPFKLKLREPVNARQNTETFPPASARFVRFTILDTNDHAEPAVDELEVWTAGEALPDGDRIYARKVFEAERPQTALLRFTADDHAIVWINGQRVAENHNWPTPQQVDVNPALRGGTNVIVVEAWSDADPAGLLVQLALQFADGRQEFINTDANWQVSRKSTKDWQTNGFNQAGTPNGKSLGKLGVAPWGDVLAKLVNASATNASPAPEWIWSDTVKPVNAALASAGSKVTSSGNLSGNLLRHQLAFVNDGIPGDKRSWISNAKGQGWVEIELPRPAQVDRVTWGRDREDAFTDRLATKYRLEVATEPGQWHAVGGSDDRLPYGAAESERLRYRRDGLSTEELKRVDALVAELQAQQALFNDLSALPMKVYAGQFKQPGPIHLLNRGDPAQPREVVGPDTVAILGKLDLPADAPEQQRRVALARWITSVENPLTARVMVNRIWQHHFGAALVATPNDFGTQGARPSHPELLDWLARRFLQSGWSVKQMHRLILASNTYRQSSAPDPRAQAADAGMRLLWRFPTHRLEAEPIHDSILAVSGALDLKMGGPGFNVFEPTRHHVRIYTPKQHLGPPEWRRMIYMTGVRMEHDAVFGAFDSPDGGLVCPKRSRSTTAMQAFNLLNSDFLIQQADLFAQRLAREVGEQPEAQVRRAFQLAFGRAPDAPEMAAARNLVKANGPAALGRALFNANEFLFLP